MIIGAKTSGIKFMTTVPSDTRKILFNAFFYSKTQHPKIRKYTHKKVSTSAAKEKFSIRCVKSAQSQTRYLVDFLK